jgi:hypothetical protein
MSDVALRVGAETADADRHAATDAATRCFRHPDRETLIRCGRCDRPICTKCAMQGPVGMRCRDCGRPGPDPLTTLNHRQLGAGVAVAVGAGTLAGFVGLQMGFLLSLCVGPFIGGLIGEGVMRATGYKRGNRVRAIVLLGLIGGLLLAIALDYLLVMPEVLALPVDAIAPLFWTEAASSLVFLAAATVGAFARLR